jgi:hypothetical protein
MKIDRANWMSDLGHDSTRIGDLNLPGTHDSAAITPWARLAPVAPWSRQSRSITDQLMNGIRLLDIRISVGKDDKGNFEFWACHDRIEIFGWRPTSLYRFQRLREVLSECDDFLQNHGREFIALSLKIDDSGGHDAAKFGGALNDLVRVTVPVSPTYLSVPTLKEVRGKVFIINRIPQIAALGHPLHFPNNATLARLPPEGYREYGVVIQDRYDGPNCAEKQRAFFVAMECRSWDKDELSGLNCIKLNFASFTYLKISYGSIVNSIVARFGTKQDRPTEFLGWILFDFENLACVEVTTLAGQPRTICLSDLLIASNYLGNDAFDFEWIVPDGDLSLEQPATVHLMSAANADERLAYAFSLDPRFVQWTAPHDCLPINQAASGQAPFAITKVLDSVHIVVVDGATRRLKHSVLESMPAQTVVPFIAASAAGSNDIALCAVNQELHLLASIDGQLLHTIRNGLGNWTSVTRCAAARRASASAIGLDVHICYIDEQTGKPKIIVRRSDGSFHENADLPCPDYPITAIACTATANELHVFYIGHNDKLYHVRKTDSTVVAPVDLGDKPGGPGRRNDLYDLAASAHDGDVHLLVSNRYSEVWHTTRCRNGAWTSFSAAVVPPKKRPGKGGMRISAACTVR